MVNGTQTRTAKAIHTIALMPFVLFSLIAPGTMPVYSENGLEIVICSGTETKTVTIDLEDGHPAEALEHPCAWGAQFHIALVPQTILPQPTIVAFDINLPTPATVVVADQKDPSYPGARGPPHLL